LNISKVKAAIFLLMLSPFFLGSMKNKEIAVFYDAHSSINNDSTTCDSLISFAKKYIKKPYCYGSRPPKCFDCSGFVNFVFGNFKTSVPNSSSEIALYGKFISFANVKAGDLIFFTGSKSQTESVGHVGIITEIKDGAIYFIHASVRAGIIISHTEEKYYKERLLFVKRVKIN
jgi:cell wall-associated NlpC family hydrolase